MQIHTKIQDGALVATIRAGRLDCAGAIGFRAAARPFAETAARRVVLDMREVGFMDSSGLWAVLNLSKTLGPDMELVLCNLRSPVARLVELTGVAPLLSIAPSLEAALAPAPQAAPVRTGLVPALGGLVRAAGLRTAQAMGLRTA